MTNKSIKNLATVLNYGKPFYASDLGFNGGEISALSYYQLIKETGNSKKYYVDLGDDYAKKVEVYEWVANCPRQRIKKQITQLQTEIDTLLKALEILENI